MENSVSRRWFIGGAAAAAQAVGIKAADLPDLSIKEVKVYVLGNERLAAVVTTSGIEGNYTLGSRYWHPNWSNLGWLEYARARSKAKECPTCRP